MKVEDHDHAAPLEELEVSATPTAHRGGKRTGRSASRAAERKNDPPVVRVDLGRPGWLEALACALMMAGAILSAVAFVLWFPAQESAIQEAVVCQVCVLIAIVPYVFARGMLAVSRRGWSG